jgi:hypothetical protein
MEIADETDFSDDEFDDLDLVPGYSRDSLK